MNILPKKRWHVRTKENIARVRKDEAEAAEKEKLERLRTENADREARLNFLKNRSKEKLHKSGVQSTHQENPETEPKEHINFFTDLDHTVKSTNKEHDQDVKEKKEEYEKQIGYLTYLGQDTNEALGKKNWYEVLPELSRFNRTNEIKDTYNKLVIKDIDGRIKTNELNIKGSEVAWKAKQQLDPMNMFKDFLPKKIPSSGKHKNKIPSSDYHSQIGKDKKCKNKIEEKHKNTKHDKNKKLQELREARLIRELKEKEKTQLYLAGLNGVASTATTKTHTPGIKPKYNSQFNPELARQNYL